MMRIQVPNDAAEILRILRSSGFEAYIVGGFVRDSVISSPSGDVDITTSALPNEISEIFNENYVSKNGLKHGSVGVVYKNTSYEITTFRIDGEYKDHRHPESIIYTRSLREDIKRRDFTINTLCCDSEGNVIDTLGAIDDISNKLIRTVGDPDKRFHEDALRILRGIRFASVLGFRVDSATARSMHRNKHLLGDVSQERITEEFMRTICGAHFREAFNEFRDIFLDIIPELRECKDFKQYSKYHIYDVLTHSIIAASNIENKPLLRLSALFHDIGKPFCFTRDDKGEGHFFGHAAKSCEICESLFKRLKLSNSISEKSLLLIKHHGDTIENNKKQIKKAMQKLTPDLFFDLLKIKIADISALSPEHHYRTSELNEIRKTAEEIIKENECLNISDLSVNGNDLIDIGFTQGKDIGKTLSLLLEEVLSDNIKNEKNILLNRAKEILQKKETDQ